MPFPVDALKYHLLSLDEPGVTEKGLIDRFSAFAGLLTEGLRLHGPEAAADVLHAFLDKHGLVAAQKVEPFPGQIARVQIDAYGESAAEVEATLLAYASRCDAASQAETVAYGRCVIERNLEEEWGATYSWRGRLVLHPTIGTIESSVRAAAAIEK